MKKSSIFTIYFLILILNQNFAQQYPLFSNFVTNRYAFNPAITTSAESVEANFVYRNQWAGLEEAPQTQVLNIRGRLAESPFGLGAQAFNDQAGALKRTGIGGTLAYVRNVGENTTFSAGLSGGYFNIRLSDNYRVQKEDDVTLATALDGTWVPDFTVGLLLESKGFFAGFSIPQVFEKDLNFSPKDIEVSSYLERHYYGMAGYRFEVNEKFQIEPSALVKYARAAPIQTDLAVKMTFQNTFWIAGSYRISEAVSAMGGIQFGKNMTLSYAYDMTATDISAYSTGSHEITIGLKIDRRRDNDNDGIPDKEDECPNEPGPKSNNGCPDKEKQTDEETDSDGDGIADVDDDCPEIPGNKANNGCPFGDRDKDGIRDDIDKCPDIPGVADNIGCPVLDSDRDGITDEKDDCPDLPGPLTTNGCPGEDSDNDGLIDEKDDCPQTAGPKSNDGCPVLAASELDILNLAIRNLYFDTDKADIWNESKPYLNDLAQLLNQKRDWKLKLAGHTDYRGSDEHNVDLSKRRVEKVMFYLMDKGVRRSQLIAEYYGESKPFVSDFSTEKLQLNRRVEMEYIFE